MGPRQLDPPVASKAAQNANDGPYPQQLDPMSPLKMQTTALPPTVGPPGRHHDPPKCKRQPIPPTTAFPGCHQGQPKCKRQVWAVVYILGGSGGNLESNCWGYGLSFGSWVAHTLRCLGRLTLRSWSLRTSLCLSSATAACLSFQTG